MERELIIERTRAGPQAARRQTRGGRKRQMTDSKVQAARKLLASGTPATRGGAELRRVDPHVVSLGAGPFTDVKGLR
jgi:DNA invertase Pin-like site-specific DNA recombinase